MSFFNSPVDIAMVFGVALLVFGPKKLPELGKSVGQGLRNFKKAMNDVTEEVKSAVNDEPEKTTAQSAPSTAKPAPGDNAQAAQPDDPGTVSRVAT